ncbi:Mak10 subunit, NatC N(alpha)-terminal acetyltransferase [Seminavis robusta]|uniref:Mak10 subunit, NatC N(Alpha)-terminal acetyltransferase n=1 Tax=Seminavis robusta TaxID=568900 RepID=A0A9N8HIH9_9STRA|nr:Mak10 subunit, NatC N(alpha)-terminal acetyltransferase [Seminavis robusta]|eukprot:Sro785_g202160.1 Mak10 subunit, NatC N(alpha)-terminal acetyltransferase (770) ;mRNA; r:32995-35499
MEDSTGAQNTDRGNATSSTDTTSASMQPNGLGYDDLKDAVDITAMVDSCVDSLSFENPMLCTEGFCLQDSMAAMELLDPKMDSCEVAALQILPQQEKPAINGDRKVKVLFPRPTPTEIDDDFLPLPWNELTLRDSCLIAVEALVRLESMLGGSSVVESIYTCLYAHADICQDMKDRLLHGGQSRNSHGSAGTAPQHVVFATSLALVEISEIMRSIVLQGDIYEEEDFCANSYNVPIYSNREKGSTMEELSLALLLVRECKGAADTDEQKTAICILNFLIDLLNLCSTVARVAGARVVQTMLETKSRVLSAVQNLRDAATLWKKLIETKSTRETNLLQRAFDPFVNRPLCGNAPVRKVVFLEPAKSLEILSKIVAEVDWALCHLVLKGNSIRRIRGILDRLSKSSINIFARSLIVLNLYFDDKLLGQYSLSDLIVKHMQETAAVPSELFETKHGRLFLNRLAKPIYDTLKLRLLNRNRQRAFMEAVILQDWARLQQEAHIIDVRYRKEKGLANSSPPFVSQYVLANLVSIMDLHLAIGVELALFRSQEDLATVFWYRDFLLSTMLNVRSAMWRTKEAGNDGRHKNNKKKGHDGVAKGQETIDYEFDFALLECKRNLCRGLVRFMAALQQAGVLETRKFHFTTAEKVFRKRFEAFANIQQPPPLSFDDFRQGSSFARVSQSDLLASTGECFKSSKTSVGKALTLLSDLDISLLATTKEDLNQLAKICVGNSVYMQKLRQSIAAGEGGNQSKQQKTVFEFDSNSDFCTVKLE